MNKRNKPVVAWIFLLTAALACNLPNAQSSAPATQNQPVPQSTLPAQIQPVVQITDTFAPSATSTLTLTPTITLTFTPGVPMVTVSQNTNCRTGPGLSYDIVGALLIGESAEIVGKNTEANYWVIKNPDSSGTCWLWGQYATVSGNVAALPEMTPPPTPTPSLPKAPKNPAIAKVCVPIAPPPMFHYAGTFTWTDQSDNEDGFNVYLNGGLLGTTAPDVTSYPIPLLPFPAGTPLTMGVEAFNVTGKSAIKTVVMVCP